MQRCIKKSYCSSYRPDSTYIETNLNSIFSDIFKKEELYKVSLLEAYKPNIDDTTKFLVSTANRQPSLVVIVSSIIEPKSVIRAIEHAETASTIIGRQLARKILLPVRKGYIDGLSYAIWNYCHPLSSNKIIAKFQDIIIRDAVFLWLKQITSQTVYPINMIDLKDSVISPLQHLVSSKDIPYIIQETARWSIDRVQSIYWKPVHVLAHNDFWRGNLLIQPRNLEAQMNWANRFVIIDWLGCVHKGFGIFDLLKMARSMRLGRNYLRQELSIHCHALCCDLVDSYGHLLTALGRLGLHMEHFPRDRYVQLVSNCFQQLINLDIVSSNIPNRLLKKSLSL